MFDEANTNDISVCCDEPIGSDLAASGLTGPDGDCISAVVLSPLVKPGAVSNTSYNHYVLLKSTEDVLGPSHLDCADMSGLQGFGSDAYSTVR